jgi:polar amino acid transport system substrate-binding protein
MKKIYAFFRFLAVISSAIPGISEIYRRPAHAIGLMFPALLLMHAPLVHSAAPVEVEIFADSGYPPYSYLDKEELKGIYTEVLKAAFQQMPDYHVKLTAVPWKRGLMLLETGQGFALYPPYFRPEERPYMKYSVALFNEELSIFCDSAIIAKRKPKIWPDDYFGLSIGINAGYLSGGKAFEQAVKDGKLQLDIAQNNQSNIKKLLMGRISCYLNDKLAILAELHHAKKSALPSQIEVAEAGQVSSEQAYLGYTNRDAGRFPFRQDFIGQLNAVIAKMKQHGEIKKIANSYLIND